jgi:hypothetical protein
LHQEVTQGPLQLEHGGLEGVNVLATGCSLHLDVSAFHLVPRRKTQPLWWCFF